MWKLARSCFPLATRLFFVLIFVLLVFFDVFVLNIVLFFLSLSLSPGKQTSVRSAGFSMGGRELLVVTDNKMGHPAQLIVYEVARSADQRKKTSSSFTKNFYFSEPSPRAFCPVEDSEPVSVMDVVGSRVTTASWGPLNRYIYCGHENGEVSIWDWKVALPSFVLMLLLLLLLCIGFLFFFPKTPAI